MSKDDALHLQIIQLAYDTSLTEHLETQHCYEILTQSYHWSEMITDVKQFVRNCYLYTKIKYFQICYHRVLKLLLISEHCWTDILIDFVVYLLTSKNLHSVKCKNIMIIVNCLFKEVYYEVINNLTSLRVAQIYYSQMWKNTDLSDTIVSDCDTQFVNSFWDQLCKWLNIKTNLFTAFHPQTDSQTERVNSVMKQYLRTYCIYLQDDWVMWLLSAEFAVNNHWSESIQCTLFFTNCEYHLKMRLKSKQKLSESLSTDHEQCLWVYTDIYAEQINWINHKLQTQIIWAQSWHEEYINWHWEHTLKWQVRDKVWLNIRNLITHHSTKKLMNKNESLFEIIKVVSSHTYQLKLLNIWSCHNMFYTSLLHDAANDFLPEQKLLKSLLTNLISEADLYEIVEINDSHFRESWMKYLITWKNDLKNWWVSFENCEGVSKLLKSYHDSHSDCVREDTWHVYQACLNNSDSEYCDDPRTDSDSDK